ncbi:MAG: serine/threonine-protein kinase, partial [Planctomycetota bacterium]
MSPNETPSDKDWDTLSVQTEAFSAAWRGQLFPPEVAEFAGSIETRLRPWLVRELIKLDLEYRWQRGLCRLLEEYEGDIPDLRELITSELIFEEYQLRKQAGDRVSPAEVFQRFPEHAESLGTMLQMDPSLKSTVLYHQAAVAACEFEPGQQVDDFDLLLRLGRGAFATVFLARQRSMQRFVALKISAHQGAEGQTLAQLDHESIIRVYDQRVLEELKIRLLYMQYAAGGTLADVIRLIQTHDRTHWNGRLYLSSVDRILDQRGESRPVESTVRQRISEMSWPELICWIGSRLANALAYAHQNGVLHRDLKPANILLTAEGVPRLADFNVSFGAQVIGVTADSDFGGSLAYMSPEQLAVCDPAQQRYAAELTPASDLYSLSMVLWELLTGSRPQPVESGREQLGGALKRLFAVDHENRDAHQPARSGSSADSDDSESVMEVLSQCLRMLPDRRYTTGEELAIALEHCLNREARQLLNDRSTRWKLFVRRWPQSSIVMTTLIPNVIMAAFNFLYNQGEIRQSFPEGESTFLRIQSYINVVAFSVGIASSFWLIRTVTRATGQDPDRSSRDERVQLRLRCLQLGNTASIVSTMLWLAAGPVYPVALHLLKGDVPISIYQHFVASLSLCGLIVSAYPFFGVSLIAVRGLYPSLVGTDRLSAEELPVLKRLSGWSWFHLILAALVPMAAVLILAVSGLNRRWALILL